MGWERIFLTIGIYFGREGTKSFSGFVSFSDFGGRNWFCVIFCNIPFCHSERSEESVGDTAALRQFPHFASLIRDDCAFSSQEIASQVRSSQVKAEILINQ